MKMKLAVGIAAATLGASAVFAAQPPQNYRAATLSAGALGSGHQQLMQVQRTAPIQKGSLVIPAAKSPSLAGYQSLFDDATGAATFLWADPALRGTTVAPLKSQVMADSAARDYLGRQSVQLGLGKTTIADAKLLEVHDTGSGPVIARYQQVRNGIEVFGQQINVMMDRDMKLVATSGSFAPVDAAEPKVIAKNGSVSTRTAVASDFALPAEQALSIAFADLSGDASTGAAFVARDTADAYTVYDATARRGEIRPQSDARSKKVYFPQDGATVPAYYVEVEGLSIDGAGTPSYSYVISAKNGDILFRKDLTEYDAYTYRTYADAGSIHQPFDSPLGNGYDPFVGTAGNGNLPRNPAQTSLITIQNGPIPTNDPWLPAGATVTTGNNVEAYLDLAGTYHLDANGNTIIDSGDGYVEGSGDIRGKIVNGTMDNPYTPDADPSTDSQRQFAIVQLFYINNWLHDWWYDDGFTEAAGNAQTNNYGRGGVGNDSIKAEGQDFSGRNNANMSTPADGGRPRMQQYLFDGPVVGELTVTQPAGIGSLAFGTGSFGPQVFDVTADVVLVNDGVASTSTSDGCETPFTNAAALNGKIALIDRGTCAFAVKAKNAQTNGAVGVIIANNAAGAPPGMSGSDPSLTIGTLSVSQADGATLKNALASGTVTARLRRAASIDRDGTVDAQIVAHEWFHYVSNRLVGNAAGLSNQQGRGMGEGWSDFSAMMLTVRPEDKQVAGNDTWQGAYPQAYYSIGNAYFGIRRAPYSTSFATFPLTFKHISDGVALPTGVPLNAGGVNSEVHNTGEIWCNTLWEIYASLLNDPRYTFLQAQDRMKRYVIAGLKMTPNAPTLLEARNGLLAAAYATDKQDFALMAAAFAKRGMGVGAIAPSRTSTTNQSPNATESFVAQAGAFDLVSAALDFTYTNGVAGYTDNDGVLDPGETALLTIKVRSSGTNDITSPVTAQLTSNGDVTFGNGGLVTFPASAAAPITYGSIATGTVTVKLNSATSTAQVLTLTGSFPQVGATAGEVIEPAGFTLSTAVNYDVAPNTKAADDMSQPLTSNRDWGTTLIGTASGWALANLNSTFATGNAWYAPNSSGVSDVRLTTPLLRVGTDPFTIAFDHAYAFEFAGVDTDGTNYGYDGGVIEISTDGGNTWVDAVKAGGQFTAGRGYNGLFFALRPDGTASPDDDSAGYPGFVNNNGAIAAKKLEHVVLSFREDLAGKSVKLRFREVTDNGGSSTGWIVDNVAFTGVQTPAFSTIVADAAIPTNKAPVANAGADRVVALNTPFRLDSSGSSDPNGDPLTFQWTQTAGPATATITGASTASPTVTASVAGDYEFTVTATDIRTLTSTDAVSIRVNSPPVAKTAGDVSTPIGSAATLDGSGSSDPEGDALTYQWTQTAGPATTITGANTPRATVSPSQVGSYEYLLTVTDVYGASSTAKSTVNVAGGTGDSNGGGGAIGLWLLLPGLGAAWMRRRRRD